MRLRREDRLVAAITAELDTDKGGFKLISKEASAPSSSITPASGLKRSAASPPPSVPPSSWLLCFSQGGLQEVPDVVETQVRSLDSFLIPGQKMVKDLTKSACIHSA